MPLVMVETIDEYIEEHGEFIKVDRNLIFADGASCREDFSVRWAPPTDEWKLLEAKRYYVSEALKKEEGDFLKYQGECAQQAAWSKENRNLPGPPHDAAEQLRRGQARVFSLREQLAVVDEALSNSPQAIGKRQSEQAERERIASINERMDAINQVQI